MGGGAITASGKTVTLAEVRSRAVSTDPGVQAIFQAIEDFIGVTYVSCNASVTQNATSMMYTITYTDTRGNQQSFSSLQRGIQVIITPGSISLTGGQTQQFAAQAFDTEGDLITGALFDWTLSLGAAGTIASDGLYTAPTTVLTARTDMVTATVTGLLSAASAAVMLRVV
jgi:hypothetical protein